MTGGDGWRRTAAITFAFLMVASVIAPVAGTANTDSKRQLSAETGYLPGVDSVNPNSDLNLTDATPKQKQALAVRLASNLSSEKRGIQKNLNRAHDRFNRSLQFFQGPIRVNESKAFTHDAVGVRALAHMTRSDNATSAQKVADLIYQADNATARATVEDARRVLNRYGDSMENQGLRNSAESHLEVAEQALNRADRARSRSADGRKYFGSRAQAITQLRTAHRHAKMAIRFVDRSTKPTVSLHSRADPPRNGSEPFHYILRGTISDARPSTIQNVTVVVDGERTNKQLSVGNTTIPGKNISFRANVTLEGRIHTLTVNAEESDSSRNASTTLRLDGDGLPDSLERTKYGTNPLDPDSDSNLTEIDEGNNGIHDGNEDLDNDRFKNYHEYAFGGDPTEADTDGDGLVDGFEFSLSNTFVFNADSNNNGTIDAKEDPDGDGLTNLREQEIGTHPRVADSDDDFLKDNREVGLGTNATNPDTDDDGLLDGEEIDLGTDPLDADTDDDGILDGNETYVSTAESENPNVSVQLEGKGRIASGVTIERESGVLNQSEVIKNISVAPIVDLQSEDNFSSASVSMAYHEDAIPTNESDLIAVRFNESAQAFEPLPTTIDKANNTVTANTSHFSVFTVFVISNWQETYTANQNSGSNTTDPAINAVDTMLIMDSSGSMGGNDPNGLRKDAAKEYVGALIDGDRAGVVDFDSYAAVTQGLTEDFDAVNSSIDNLDARGGTDIASGINTAIEEFDQSSSDDRAKVAILLTDGQAPRQPAIEAAQEAASKDLKIYTIGFGNPDSFLLQRVANITGGTYNEVQDPSDLPEVFSRVAEETQCESNDGDDLCDRREDEGLRVPLWAQHYLDTGSNGRIQTSSTSADTDGDKLQDDEEILPLNSHEVNIPDSSLSFSYSYHPIVSDPTRTNTDGVGLNDSQEVINGSNPMEPETLYSGFNVMVLSNPESPGRPATADELQECCGFGYFAENRDGTDERDNDLIYEATVEQSQGTNRIYQEFDVVVFVSPNEHASENLDLSDVSAEIDLGTNNGKYGVIGTETSYGIDDTGPGIWTVEAGEAKVYSVSVSMPQDNIQRSAAGSVQRAVQVNYELTGLEDTPFERNNGGTYRESVEYSATGSALTDFTENTVENVKKTYDEGMAVASAAETGVARARSQGGGVNQAVRIAMYEYYKGKILGTVGVPGSGASDWIQAASVRGMGAFADKVGEYEDYRISVTTTYAGPFEIRLN